MGGTPQLDNVLVNYGCLMHMGYALGWLEDTITRDQAHALCPALHNTGKLRATLQVTLAATQKAERTPAELMVLQERVSAARRDFDRREAGRGERLAPAYGS